MDGGWIFSGHAYRVDASQKECSGFIFVTSHLQFVVPNVTYASSYGSSLRSLGDGIFSEIIRSATIYLQFCKFRAYSLFI